MSQRVSIESLILSVLNGTNKEDILKRDSFEYRALFLNSIEMDPTNPRYLPAKLIQNIHAEQFLRRQLTRNQLIQIYQPDNQVLIGKGCLINCIEKGSIARAQADKNFETIIELAENISQAELIQVPTVFPTSNNSYQILTGHRRFLAIVYSQGVESASQFKVYDSAPVFKKIKQFQENSSREDLCAHGKLQAFINAKRELDLLSEAKLKLGQKAISVRKQVTMLGISAGAYDNYNVLTRYPSVISLYEQGYNRGFKETKKVILDIENSYKKNFDKDLLNKADQDKISQEIQVALTQSKAKESAKPKKIAPIRVKPIHSPLVVKRLVESNLTLMDWGIDWSNVAWEDPSQVKDILNLVLTKLESEFV